MFDIERTQAQAALKLRARVCRFLFKAFSGSLAATFGIILLQGFGLWGFHLEAGFLNWLGAATVGEMAGLFAIVVKSTFPSDSGQVSLPRVSGPKS